MAAAAAAHLHHSAQSSPMTNLHQNMGSHEQRRQCQ
ncbi:hypothetical protein EVAR_101314_1, partial [Eumeta japonica]